MKPFLSKLLVLLAAVMLSGGARALGLGEAKVLSAIGEPLVVEVELLADPHDNLQAVRQARVPSAAAFHSLDLSYDAALSGARATIRRVDQRAVVRIETRRPTQDVWLPLLVELELPDGVLRRQYNVLLDPRTPADVPAPVIAQRSAVRETAVARLPDAVVVPSTLVTASRESGAGRAEHLATETRPVRKPRQGVTRSVLTAAGFPMRLDMTLRSLSEEGIPQVRPATFSQQGDLGGVRPVAMIPFDMTSSQIRTTFGKLTYELERSAVISNELTQRVKALAEELTDLEARSRALDMVLKASDAPVPSSSAQETPVVTHTSAFDSLWAIALAIVVGAVVGILVERRWPDRKRAADTGDAEPAAQPFASDPPPVVSPKVAAVKGTAPVPAAAATAPIVETTVPAAPKRELHALDFTTA